MRKIPAMILAGAVVVGLGALAGAATFAPSLIGLEPDTHEMTLMLPGGGTQTIVYAGNVPPKVTFHTRHIDNVWPAVPAFGWTMPSFAAWDPLLADLHRHFDLWPSPSLLMSLTPEESLSAALLPYSILSQAGGDGFCMRFTQITKEAGDAKPKIVSRTSGNCGTGRPAASSVEKSVGLRTAAWPQTM